MYNLFYLCCFHFKCTRIKDFGCLFKHSLRSSTFYYLIILVNSQTLWELPPSMDILNMFSLTEHKDKRQGKEFRHLQTSLIYILCYVMQFLNMYTNAL